MNTANIEIQMDAVVEICRRYSVSELSLFGSILRGDFRRDSVKGSSLHLTTT